MCSGSTKSSVGGSVELECEVKYRGSMPNVQWYNSDGEMVKSEDRTIIRLMKKALNLRDLTAEQDKQSYMCKLSIGDFMEACSMTLDVECEYNNLIILQWWIQDFPDGAPIPGFGPKTYYFHHKISRFFAEGCIKLK